MSQFDPVTFTNEIAAAAAKRSEPVGELVAFIRKAANGEPEALFVPRSLMLREAREPALRAALATVDTELRLIFSNDFDDVEALTMTLSEFRQRCHVGGQDVRR